jgi:6-phosphogluconolactonase (cycloisomerase 2 family)
MRNFSASRAGFMVGIAAALIATFGCGGGSSGSAPAAKTYVYVSQFYQDPPPINLTHGAFAQLQLGDSGELVAVAPTSLDVTSLPLYLATDPTGKYLVATTNAGTICEYMIGADGTLTPNVAATVTTGGSPEPLTFTPDGRFLIVADWLGTVSSYSLSPTGMLTLLSTTPTGHLPAFVAIDPSGQFLYVTNSNPDNTISEYSISATGVLSPIGSISLGGSGGTGLTISPKEIAYAAVYDPPSIAEFTVDPSSGTLTEVNLMPLTSAPTKITLDPSGVYAYVDKLTAGISQYTVDPATGNLVANGSDLTGVSDLTFDPSGHTALAFSDADTVSSFIIGSDGRLNRAATITLDSSSLAQQMAVSKR